MSDVNKDSAGDVAYLRDTIKAVAWDEWTEAGARAFLRDVHRLLPDLLRVVEAARELVDHRQEAIKHGRETARMIELAKALRALETP